MSMLFLVLSAITCNFIILLVLKSWFSLTICAMCLAVSIAWSVMLGMRWLGYEIEPALLALLLGQSLLGIYYLIERHVPPALHIFRLPFLLTLTAIGYTIVSPSISAGWQVVVLLTALWLTHYALYTYQTTPAVRKVASHVIACCRDW